MNPKFARILLNYYSDAWCELVKNMQQQEKYMGWWYFHIRRWTSRKMMNSIVMPQFNRLYEWQQAVEDLFTGFDYVAFDKKWGNDDKLHDYVFD